MNVYGESILWTMLSGAKNVMLFFAFNAESKMQISKPSIQRVQIAETLEPMEVLKR